MTFFEKANSRSIIIGWGRKPKDLFIDQKRKKRGKKKAGKF